MHVANSYKQYEGRPSGKFYCGDLIEFYNMDRSVRVEITEVLTFSCWEAAFVELGIDAILPGVKSLTEAIDVYREFYGAETFPVDMYRLKRV